MIDFSILVAQQYDRFAKRPDIYREPLPGIVQEPAALDAIHHAIEELVEVRQEFPGRKPWKVNPPPIEIERVLDEMADVLIFLGSALAYLGLQGSELEEALLAKLAFNRHRPDHHQPDGIST